MLILVNTTDKISLVTSKAGNVHVMACFTDRNQTTGAVGVSDRQVTSIVTAATTDIVGVPGSTTTRNIKALHICNANTHGQAANGDNTVTVQFDANGTLYELYKATLEAGDILQYIEGVGFGVQKIYAPMDRTVVTTSDQVFNAAGVFAAITGLSIDLSPGITSVAATYEYGRRYNFLAHIYHISAVNTTGCFIGLNFGNVPVTNGYRVCAIDCIAGTANTAATLASGTTTAQDTAIIVETAGVAVVGQYILSGYLINPDNNNPGIPFSVIAAAEVSANMTIKRGSWLRVWEQPRRGA